jgi:hypothetical protein
MLDREDSMDEMTFPVFSGASKTLMPTGDFLPREAFAKAGKAITGANGGFEGNTLGTERQQISRNRVVLHPIRKRNALKKIIRWHRFFLDTELAQNYTFVSCNELCCGIYA